MVMTLLAIVYRVSIPAPATHLVHVELAVSALAPMGALPDELVLFMATWTPGSYLIREYARHLEGLNAPAPATLTKIRKNAWCARPHGTTRLVVSYRAYAGELTVRTSHVDETHAFLVGAALFLGIEGYEDTPVRVDIEMPPGFRAATPLGRRDGASGASATTATVQAFDAPNFDALVDDPIELGTHREESFQVLQKPHRLSICPASAITDSEAARLVTDIQTLVETEARLFGGSLPYEAYDLLLHLSARGRGGLEHRSSAALIAPRTSFGSRESYLDLLSLVAHEMFHAWNVKRIRPAGLSPYRYGEECYTRLLWWFEGGTSYYDWRILALSRLCTLDEYLDHLAGEIGYLEQTPGRGHQSLEEASYDAWIKLYRPDENSANSSINYYRKGEVVCAMLDLEIAARTRGTVTLDHVLAHLWRAHGQCERPIAEDAMQSMFEEVAGVPLGDLFAGWIRGTAEIPCDRVLAQVGLSIERAPRGDAPPCSLGLRLRAEGGRTLVSGAIRESSAWRAGFEPGDEIVAVGGARVEGTHLENALRGQSAGQSVPVTFVREGRISTRAVTLDPARKDRFKIVPHRDAAPAAREAFTAWLGQAHPAWSPGRP
jgi:predicted metalloprotease with PDZ domain